MSEQPCPLCRGFGLVYPLKGDRVDYATAAYCACQGDKALKTAHPTVAHPDVTPPSVYDAYDEARQRRYRASVSFHQETDELFGEADNPSKSPFTGRETCYADLTPVRAELAYLRNKLNEHIDYARRRKESRL